MQVKYSDLDQQYAEVGPYLGSSRDLVTTGDFTLGDAVGTVVEVEAAGEGAQEGLDA